MALPEPSTDGLPDGLIVALPAETGGEWRWWRVADGAVEASQGWLPGEDAPWGVVGAVTALVPAAAAPVREKPLPALPIPQAVAAERLGLAGAGLGAERQVAVAASTDSLLSSIVATADMDCWLAECAAAGLDPAALVPAALVLRRPASGMAVGKLEGQPLARTADAAFAGEPALVEAFGGDVQEADAAAGLLAVHIAPPLNLRQGPYAPRRVAFFLLPDWLRLARMAAVAALLALVLMLVWTVKWNLDASAREDEALAAVQKRFPAATDLATAERLVAGELARRGQGGAAFSAPAAALLTAMRSAPSVKLRDMGYNGDGALRFTAAAPRPDDINVVLLALQRDGWKVTVPTTLAPDATGATVAPITVVAP